MGSHRYPPSLRRALYDRALARNIVPPGGVYSRPAMRVAPFYEQFGVQFVWDLPYSTIAVAQVGGRVDLARGFVQNMLDLAITEGPDAGMVPRSVTWEGGQAGQDGSQTPLLAWLSRQLHEQEPDRDFVASVYAGLAAFVDWWQSPRRDYDGDGLSEFGGSTPTYVAYESGHDFSPERDIVMGEPTPQSDDGVVHEPIADVFLNACLYAELDALASFATDLGDARAAEWGERRDALAARMTEAMWDEEVGGFFPVIRRDLCAAQPRVYHHTPALLQPLWAGLATQEQADRTVATLRQVPRRYPHFDAIMRVDLDPSLYHGYRVVTDGLHPTRGEGGAAGGVEVHDGGFVARFGADRGPAHTAFGPLSVEVDVRRADPGAHVTVVLEDRHGNQVRALAQAVDGPGPLDSGTVDPFDPNAHDWTDGLRRIELQAEGCDVASVTLRHRRMDRAGLLSAYGIKSAHPLDGKHPGPGAPTQFWSGTIWGPHQLHGCHALRRYGYDDLARACARAFCDAAATSFAAGGEAFEHLSHEDGRGLGITDYTWTASVALVLMQDFIDDDTEGGRG